MSSGAPSIFDSFNARYLAPAEVARTFVPPPQYETLIRRTHTVVIGPRGAGKTTLLKMLQGPALDEWEHPDAERIRGAIDFTGVFVPADRTWATQVDALGVELNPELRALFSVAAFTAHVLSSVVEAMEFRVGHDPAQHRGHRGVVLREDREELLAREVGRAWHFGRPMGSLAALRHGLEDRVGHLWELASDEARRPPLGRADRLASHPELSMQFQHSAISAISRFNDLAGDHSGRWALLFDEVELIPETLRAVMFRLLRSFDERLLFKLSVAPFTEGAAELFGSVMEKHDYDVISLTYPHRDKAASDFCRALLHSMLTERGLKTVDAETLLGPSEFESRPDEWAGPEGSAYSASSRLGRRLAELRDRDATFREWLAHQRITVDQLGDLPGDERAKTVRKVTSIAALRNFYRADDDTFEKAGRRLRPRKSLTLYAGATSMFAMVEGNPRWFIGIMSELIGTVQNDARPVRIPSRRQATEITRANNLFRKLLEAIPSETTAGKETSRGVLQLLDRIGLYLFEESVIAPFNPDPPGSFRVDLPLDPDLHRDLRTAVNAGAIILVPRRGEPELIHDFTGRRFRLAYLLAPHYRIGLTLGRPVSLSTILRRKDELTVALDDEDGEEERG